MNKKEGERKKGPYRIPGEKKRITCIVVHATENVYLFAQATFRSRVFREFARDIKGRKELAETRGCSHNGVLDPLFR